MPRDETKHFPQAPIDRERKTAIEKRKRIFASLNRYVSERGGWLVSVPGAVDVTMECLPDSTLPDDIARLGHDVKPDGETTRILPAAITERFVRGADGKLEPLTEGSTRPIAETRTHAGIVQMLRYAFSI
jgi:hypothetical protein